MNAYNIHVKQLIIIGEKTFLRDLYNAHLMFSIVPAIPTFIPFFQNVFSLDHVICLLI